MHVRTARFVFLLSFASAACSSAPPADPPLVTEDANGATARGGSRSSADEAPSAQPLTGAPAPSTSHAPSPSPPPPAGLVTRTGTLATTTTVEYGGDPYCLYRETLSDVTVDIRTDASGAVVAASVEAKAVEEAVQPCPHAPLAPNEQLYHLERASPTGAGQTRIVLEAASKNLPKASLVVDVDLSSPSTTATLAWHRIDAGPPFDWTIIASVPIGTM